MIIPDIPYVRLRDTVQCSMSACLSMALAHYRQFSHPEHIADLFGRVFLSREFQSWHTHSLDTGLNDDSASMTCACYIIEHYYRELTADIIRTDVDKIASSYLKRRIPVIVTGRFPLLSGRIANSILLKGYVDTALIANDPRGNARAGYIDRYGEDMIYPAEMVRECLAQPVSLLRILQR